MKNPHEGEADQSKVVKLSMLAQVFFEEIAMTLFGTGLDEKVGFALITFNMEGPEATIVSNAGCDSVTHFMEKLTRKIRSGEVSPPPGYGPAKAPPPPDYSQN